MQRTVKVWSEDVEVTVEQSSKSVWIAGGTYMGQYFTVKGRSANSATGLWRDAARYKGN